MSWECSGRQHNYRKLIKAGIATECCCVGQIPEPALALLSDEPSEAVPPVLRPETASLVVGLLALPPKPAVRLPFDADAEPTLAPEMVLLLEPSPASKGPTMNTGPFPALAPFVLTPAAEAFPLLAAPCSGDWAPLYAAVACCKGTSWEAEMGAAVTAAASFRAVAGCSLCGNGSCITILDNHTVSLPTMGRASM